VEISRDLPADLRPVDDLYGITVRPIAYYINAVIRAAIVVQHELPDTDIIMITQPFVKISGLILKYRADSDI
jgi:hypothetical protein